MSHGTQKALLPLKAVLQTVFSFRSWQVRAIIASFIILLPSLLQPFNNDVDFYQAMGWQLAHFNQLPCFGTWAHTLPTIVYLHASVITIFGTSPVAFQSIALLTVLIQSALLFRLSSRLFSEEFAFYCAVSAAALYMWGGTWLSAQLDVFATTAILLAVTLCYRVGLLQKPLLKIGRFVITVSVIGALLGFAVCLRPTYGMFVIIIACILIFMHKSKAMLPLFLIANGFIAVFLLTISPYFFTPSGMHELYLAALRFNFDVYATTGHVTSFNLLLHHRVEILCDVVVTVWFISFLITKRKNTKSFLLDRASVLLFFLSMVAARLSIVIMGKFYVQHYAMLLMLTAFPCAVVISQFTQAFPTIQSKFPWVSTILLILILLRFNFAPFYLAGLIQGKEHPVEYAYYRSRHEPADKLIMTLPVVDYLAKHLLANERLEVFGTTPGIYWRTRTASASRFTTMNPLVLENRSTGLTLYQKQWRREFIDSLCIVRPQFIVIAMDDVLNKTASVYRHEIDGFDSLISTDYMLDTMFSGWEIYRRK